MNNLEYLEEVIERSKDTRRCFFGPVQTSKAWAAEQVLLANVESLITEIRLLRQMVAEAKSSKAGAN